MNGNIHNLIKSEYEKKQKKAYDDLVLRRDEVYSKLPRIQEIENEVRISGIRYNKMILTGSSSVDYIVKELEQKTGELNREKEDLLLGAGYPSDFLVTKYECQACKDTGLVEVEAGFEKCRCHKQLLINHLYSQSNLQLSKMENFSTFDESFYPDAGDEAKYGLNVSPRENILLIKERCLSFIENFDLPEEKNLFFSGPTGVGKTFMTNCLAAELINRGKTVLYQTAPELFNTITEYKMKAFREDEFDHSTYKNIFEVELLIIDDLGTENQTSARYAELLNILNTRQSNNLIHSCKTVISTNIGPKKLYEYYTERVASRIVGCFDRLMFVGEDIRSIKARI